MVLPIPTTKVGKPAAAAFMTAVVAPGESSLVWLLPPGAQFGKPSVARSRYLGFGVGEGLQ